MPKHGRREYWQSADLNRTSYYRYLQLLESLAINRYRWVGLPETCDVRYLESRLLRGGVATIAHSAEVPDVWVSLMVGGQTEVDIYGYPVRWRAMGANGTYFDVDADNGVLVYDSMTMGNPWIAIQNYAYRLAKIDEIEDCNLDKQRCPYFLIAPQEKKAEIVNIYKQIAGGEPAILGDSRFGDMMENVKALDVGVEFIGDKLELLRRNVMNDALTFLGIPHLAFEKGERMIEDEARAYTAQTETVLLNGLQSRRIACKQLKERFGLDVDCVYNVDVESYNYNYTHNVEASMQDDKKTDLHVSDVQGADDNRQGAREQGR